MKYLNSEKTLIAIEHSDGRVECIEIGDARFAELVAQGVEPYEPPAPESAAPVANRQEVVAATFQELAQALGVTLTQEQIAALKSAPVTVKQEQ